VGTAVIRRRDQGDRPRDRRALADLAGTFPFEEPAKPTAGEFGLIVREPVGVVGAIIPWNAPMGLISNKVAPALPAGCTVILKSSPEAPGEGYLIAEAAGAAGLPPGVLNVVTADREVSELLVRDPRVDKITFTGPSASNPGSRCNATRRGDLPARHACRAGRSGPGHANRVARPGERSNMVLANKINWPRIVRPFLMAHACAAAPPRAAAEPACWPGRSRLAT